MFNQPMSQFEVVFGNLTVIDTRRYCPFYGFRRVIRRDVKC